MTERDLVALFVTLSGYWPNSAPAPDDRVALAAHASVLGDLAPTVVLEAVKSIALGGGEFCPPPGVIAAACKPKIIPPYHADYVPELVESVCSDDEAKDNIARIREQVADLAERKRLPASGVEVASGER